MENKKVKKAEKFDKELKKIEYKRQIRQKDMDTLLKIKERKQKQKELKKSKKKNKKESPTGEM